MQQYHIENELMRQKDHIIGLVNDEKYEEALSLLNFSADLWARVGYDYKTREIRERIKRDIKEHLWNCSHWKTEEKWNKLLVQV